jgi:hypothetical protein
MKHAQSEFLVADWAQPELPHALDALFQEIAAAWGLPVGRRVRVSLRDPALPEMAAPFRRGALRGVSGGISVGPFYGPS